MTAAPGPSDCPSTDVDLWSDAVLADPYPTYARLRDSGAGVRLARHDLYALTRFDAVQSALTDWRVSSSASGTCVDPAANEQQGDSLLSTDPPAHTGYRRTMASQLSVRSLAADAAHVEQTARTLTEGLSGRGSIDVVADLARPYALSVLGDVLGLEEDGREDLPAWSESAFNVFGPADERFAAGLSDAQALAAHAAATAEPGGVRPGSRGAELVERGEALAAINCTWPGLATTVDAISSAVYLFARHPEQWELVRREPSLIAGAFHEVLRLHTPLHHFTRRTTEPVEVDGVEVPGGSRVLVMYGSANRDERHYPRPDEFDVRRDPTDQLAFGRGVHRCVGMDLATLEAHTLLGVLAERVERFDLVGEPVWTRNNTLHGLTSAVVSLSPAA